MLATLPVLAFDETAADAYRRIVEAVGYSRGKLLDRMIAAQALVHRATLVTLNAGDLRDVRVSICCRGEWVRDPSSCPKNSTYAEALDRSAAGVRAIQLRTRARTPSPKR